MTQATVENEKQGNQDREPEVLIEISREDLENVRLLNRYFGTSNEADAVSQAIGFALKLVEPMYHKKYRVSLEDRDGVPEKFFTLSR